ncbi:MAG: ABC transporter permease [Chloroflexota bacterium]|nr:ABC transporter permease [Chloroflexota bacterium]
MLRNIFSKSLWDQRRSLPAWAFEIAALAAMYAAFYPSVHRSGIATYYQSLSPGLRKALGVTEMASPVGYLQSSVFGLLVPLLVILFAVVTGARAIAGDEEAGTLDLLLAHPVGRTQAVLQRFAALVVATLAIGAVLLIALLVVASLARLDVAAGNLAAMVLHLVLLGVCFGAFALAMGAAVGRRGPVFAATAVVGVLTYLANTLAPQVGAVAWLQKLSPFYYYAGGQPLRHGVQLGGIGVLAAVSAALVAAGAVAFERRDVGV